MRISRSKGRGPGAARRPTKKLSRARHRALEMRAAISGVGLSDLLGGGHSVELFTYRAKGLKDRIPLVLG